MTERKLLICLQAAVVLAVLLSACMPEMPSKEPPTLKVYLDKPEDAQDPHLWLLGTDAELTVWVTNPELVPQGDDPQVVTCRFHKNSTKHGDKAYVTLTIVLPDAKSD